MQRLSLPLAGLAAIALTSCLLEQKEPGGAPPSARYRKGGPEVAFPGTSGTPRAGTLHGNPIRYRQVDVHAVFGGDIVLDGVDLSAGPLRKEASVGRSLAASRWVNNLVYYRFAAGFTRAAEAGAAMAHWESATPLRFVRWDATLTGHPDMIEFQSAEGAGCFSGGIGRMGGVQAINLGAGCSAGNAIHEIGHAIGLYHEQSRSDQASAISIDFNNLPAAVKDRYYVFNNPLRAPAPLDGADHGTMDFGSIMMDGSFDFAVNPALPVMQKLADNSTWTAQRTALSAGDIAGVGSMYPSFWKTLPGVAVEIGVGANGAAFMLGTALINGGNQAYKWSGTAWTIIPAGGGLRLDVEPTGVLWTVNSYGDMYSLNGTNWNNKSGGKKFHDLGIGSEGSVFGVTQTASGAGFQLVKRSGSTWATFASGGATRVTVDNTGKPWIVNSAGAVQRWNGTAWVTLPGSGTDIGAGPDGTVYLIETVGAEGGKAVSIWNGVGWSRLDKGGVAVDVGPNGDPWMPTAAGAIWVGSGVAGSVPQPPVLPGWTTEAVTATQVGVGGTIPAPVAWVMTATDVNGGKSLYTKAGTGAWQSFVGGLIDVDVSPNGELWGINSFNDLYTNTGAGWIGRSGGLKFSGLGVGGNGTAFALTMTPSGKGFELVKYTGASWSPFASGGAVKIAVDNVGKPWIVNNEGNIKRWDGSAWIDVPGGATDIGAGGDGVVYKVGITSITGGKIVSKWNGIAWLQIDAAAVAIDVDAAGNPWLVGADNSLKSWNSGTMPPLKTVPDADPTPGPADWVIENVQAKEIGVGGTAAAPVAYAVGTGTVNGGNTLYKKTATAGAPWELTTGGQLRLDADASGAPWVVNNVGDAYTLSGTTWVNKSLGRKFNDISVGGDGSIFAVTQTVSGAGYQVIKWTGSVWADFASGGAVRVTVDTLGRPWIVNSRNAVWRWNGAAWIALPGSGTDIGSGGGKTFKVGTVDVTGGKTVWVWADSLWKQIEGSAIAVDADAAGNPYMVQSDFVVKSWNPGTAAAAPALKANPDGDPDTIAIPVIPSGWVTEAATATDVGIGGSASAITGWIATDANGDGGKTLKRKGAVTAGVWQAILGAGIRVDSDPSGNLWNVNGYEDLWYYSNGAWTNRSSGRKFSDVSVGGEGSVFAVSKTAWSAGFQLLKWSGSAWTVFASGGAVKVTVDNTGKPWIVNNRNAVHRWNGTAWAALPGSASDIGSGGGKTFKVGTVDVTGGRTVWTWADTVWKQIDGAAVAVDADPAGIPYLVQSDFVMKSWNPGTAGAAPALKATPDADPDTLPPQVIPAAWVTEAATATEIGTGGPASNPVSWIATDANGDGGKTIKFKSPATGGAWMAIVGAGIRVEGDPAGNLWNLNGYGDMWYYSNGAWSNRSVGKKFNDIGVGSEGSVFAVTKTPASKGFSLCKWSGSAWIDFASEGAIRVSVDNAGKPWIVDSYNAVKKWDGASWVTTPGSGSDVGAGLDGTVYKVGTVAIEGGKTVWKWTGSAWSQIDAAAAAIDVDFAGYPVLVRADNVLKTWDPGSAGQPPPAKASPDEDPAPAPPPPIPGSWQTETATATEIGLGGTLSGVSAWVATDAEGSGGKTLKLKGPATFGTWQSIVGAGIRVDGDPSGNLWNINGSNDLWYYSNGSWTNRSIGKKFLDIGVGSEGSVFAVTQTPTTKGYILNKWTGSAWNEFASEGAIRVTVDNTGRPWIVDVYNSVKKWDGAAWVVTPGSGTDIGAGGDGTVYKIGTLDIPGGNTVWKWTGAAWAQIEAAAVAIDVDIAGNPWLVRSDFVVKSWNPGTIAQSPPLKAIPDPDPTPVQPPAGWLTEATSATEIGVAGNAESPTAWVTTTADATGGKALNRKPLLPPNGDWQPVAGGAVRLDVDPSGFPWVVTDAHQIQFYFGSWVNRSAGMLFQDVGVGSQGSVFAVNMTPAGKGFQVVKWTGSTWALHTDIGAVRITVDNSGNPWLVNSENAVLRWNGATWITLPGSATDIGAGADGTIYKVGTVEVTGGRTVWKWSGSAWIQIDAGAIAVDVDRSGNPWLVQSDFTLKSWYGGPGSASPPLKPVPDADPEPAPPVPPSDQFTMLGASGDILAMFGTGAPSGYALSKADVGIGGYRLLQITGATATSRSKRFLDIDVGKDCEVWAVTDTGTVFFNANACADPEAWQPGSDATSPYFVKVLAGPDAATGQSMVFGISNVTGLGGGGRIYFREPSGSWSLLTNNGMTEADVQNNGRIFGIQSGQVVIYHPGNVLDEAQPMGLANALNIASGAGREVALINSPASGGTQLKAWTDQGWVTLSPSQGFTDVQIAPNGMIWATDSGKKIWFMNPTFAPGMHPPAPGGFTPNF